MLWRLRALIESEVEVVTGTVSVDGGTLSVFEVSEENTDGGSKVPPNVRYCDVFAENNENDILEAFALLYDRLNTYLDRISVVSYGKVHLHNILSITPASVVHGEEFEIAIPQFMFERKTNPVKIETLKLDDMPNDYRMRLERLLRLGLNSSSEEEKFIHYYSLLEEIARTESEEYIENECENCKHKVNTGRKKTNNFIKTILRSHGIEEKLVRDASEIRNKIAHGGAIKNKEFYSIVSSLNSYLEECCLMEIEKRSTYSINNRVSAHIIDIPVVTHKCVCNNNGTFDLMSTNHRVPARFVRLPHGEEAIFKGSSAMLGIPLDRDQRPIIDPFSWPQVNE